MFTLAGGSGDVACAEEGGHWREEVARSKPAGLPVAQDTEAFWRSRGVLLFHAPWKCCQRHCVLFFFTMHFIPLGSPIQPGRWAGRQPHPHLTDDETELRSCSLPWLETTVGLLALSAQMAQILGTLGAAASMEPTYPLSAPSCLAGSEEWEESQLLLGRQRPGRCSSGSHWGHDLSYGSLSCF